MKETSYRNPKTHVLLGAGEKVPDVAGVLGAGDDGNTEDLLSDVDFDNGLDGDGLSRAPETAETTTKLSPTDKKRRKINQQLQKEDSKRLSLTDKIMERRRLEKLLPNLFQNHQSWRDRRNVTSKKLPARFFLMTFTVLHFMENFLNSAGVLNWYDDSYSSPSIFCPLSFQSLFTHFIINSERVYSGETASKKDPEPAISFHPFQRPYSTATVCLRIHYWMHFVAYIFPLLKPLLTGGKVSIVAPIVNIVLSPILYVISVKNESKAKRSGEKRSGTERSGAEQSDEYEYEPSASLRFRSAPLRDATSIIATPRRCFPRALDFR